MKKYIAVTGVILALGLSTQGQAHAATGGMTQAQFDAVDITLPDSSIQSDVQADCVCTGDIMTTGTRNGNPTRQVRYYSDVLNTWDYINYVKRDADGKWHAYSKLQGSGVGARPIRHRHAHH